MSINSLWQRYKEQVQKRNEILIDSYIVVVLCLEKIQKEHQTNEATEYVIWPKIILNSSQALILSQKAAYQCY